tara:strand:+ start:3410 stop:4465 length:1056 start_codon:yes stop_codon:yes gene_type:complete
MKSYFIIKETAKIKEALKKIKRNGLRTLIVLEKNNKLLGTISDGDIRKKLLGGKSLNHKIKNSINRNPIFYIINSYKNKNLKRVFEKRQIGLIPLVNNKKDKIVKKILTLKDLKLRKKTIKSSNYKVVIMAGGKGTRLKPYTNVLPKPLMPLGNKTLIELIMENFVKYKINKFKIIINYKSNLIKSFFQNTKKLFKISFIDEKKPLGTAGGLGLINPGLGKNFLVANCDTIFKFNFHEMCSYHEKNKNLLTLAVSAKSYQFQYGACKTDKNGLLKSIIEKPKYNFFINTGLYVMNTKVLKLIKKNKPLDMNHLIEKCIQNKFRVGTFQLKNNSWLDVGQLSEFKKASKRIR